MRFAYQTPLAILSIVLMLAATGCVETPSADSPRIPTSDSSSGTQITGRPAPAADTGDTTATAGADATISEPVADSCLVPAESQVWTAEVLRLTNQMRADAGVGPLVWSDTLALEAEDYACALIDLDFFAHVSPDGETLRERADRFSYAYWSIGENLAGGQTTPAQVVREWFESPSHRENLLNPAFTELGIAVRLGGEYRIYWVQEFGRPIAAGPFNE